MLSQPDERPVADESAIGFGLLDPEPSPQERAFIARVVEMEAAQAADAAVVADLPPESGGARLATLTSLSRVAFGPEVKARAGFAQSLRAVHALVAEVLDQDLAVYRRERSKAMDYAEQEVAAALGVTRRTASIRIEDALLMVPDFARTLAVLEAGFVPVASARELAHRLGGEPALLRTAVEAQVLDTLGARAELPLGSGDLIELAALAGLEPDRAMRISLGASRARVRDLVARALRELRPQFPTSEAAEEPAAADEATPEKPTARAPLGDVEIWPSSREGYVFLGRETAEAEAEVIVSRLEHLARSSKRAGDPRPLGELRGAWFSALLLSRPPATGDGGGEGNDGGSGGTDCPTGPGAPCGPGLGLGLGLVPVPVHLTVHLNGNVAVDADRLGPLSPGTLTELLRAARDTDGRVRLRRVQMPDCPGHPFDVDGAVLDPGPYDIPDRLREAVQARDRTCRFQGCMVPARSGDLDHSIPHPRGPTCGCNLACLCRRHHRLKTSGRWKLINHGDGHLTWISPTGRTYDVVPDPV